MMFHIIMVYTAAGFDQHETDNVDILMRIIIILVPMLACFRSTLLSLPSLRVRLSVLATHFLLGNGMHMKRWTENTGASSLPLPHS